MYWLKHLLEPLQSKPVAKEFQGRQHMLQEWHVLAPQQGKTGTCIAITG